MKTLVLGVVGLLLFNAGLFAAPLLNTAELLLAPALTLDVVPVGSTSTTVASNGTDFLVVWVESRGTLQTIRAARFTFRSELEVLDAPGIIVATRRDARTTRLVVASDGDDYLLAYDCGSAESPSTCTAVVSADGVVTHPAMQHPGTPSDLAWNGSEFLLAYRRPSLTTEPYPSVLGRLLTRDGSAAGTAEIELGVGYGGAVASDGTDFFVVWTRDQVEGRVVKRDGSIGPLRHVGPPASGRIAVASNGVQYLVVWEEQSYYRLEARFLNAEGVAFGPSVFGVRYPLGAGAAGPVVTWHRDRFVVAYFHRGTPAGNEIRAIDVFDELTVGDELTIVSDGRQNHGPWVVTNGERVLIAWAGANEFRVYDAATGTTESILTLGLRSQNNPVTSPSTDHDLVVWSELAGESYTRALYVKPAFAAVPPARVHASDFDQSRPAISGGASPMIFWIETGPGINDSVILGKRVRTDGSVFEGPPVRIGETSPENGVAVATIGARHYLFWVSRGQLVMTRVTEDAFVIDATPIPIITMRSREVQRVPAVATDGSSLLVAWNSVADDPCSAFPCEPPLRLDLARVTVDGVPAATAAVDERWTFDPAVVWNGTEYAVFWVDSDLGGLGARRFDHRGRAIDPQSRLIEPQEWSERLTIGWNGREYVQAEHVAEQLRPPHELFVNRISRDLRLISEVSLNNTEEKRVQADLLLARPGRGDFVVYAKSIHADPFLGTSRIILRSLTSVPRVRGVRR